jgi:integrase
MIDLRKHAESYGAKLAVNITKTVQGADGNRITRGTLQYRILRASKTAGLNGERPSGALVHGLRHTFATELANANVSVYTLMKLLRHVHPHDDPGEWAGAHDLTGLIERILQAALGS